MLNRNRLFCWRIRFGIDDAILDSSKQSAYKLKIRRSLIFLLFPVISSIYRLYLCNAFFVTNGTVTMSFSWEQSRFKAGNLVSSTVRTEQFTSQKRLLNLAVFSKYYSLPLNRVIYYYLKNRLVNIFTK